MKPWIKETFRVTVLTATLAGCGGDQGSVATRIAGLDSDIEKGC